MKAFRGTPDVCNTLSTWNRMCVMTLESGTNCSDFIQTKNTEMSPLHSTHWESSLIFAFGLFFIYILPIPLFSFCFFLFLLMSHNELESIWAGPSIRDTSQDVSVTRGLPNPLCFFFLTLSLFWPLGLFSKKTSETLGFQQLSLFSKICSVPSMRHC